MQYHPCVQGRAPTAQGGPLIDRRSKADLATENVALRRELAKLQGVQPDEVCRMAEHAMMLPVLCNCKSPGMHL